MSESKKPFRPPGTDLALAREAPWLAPAREQVQRAIAAGRLSHALQIVGPPGLGTAGLAEWIARAALCDRPASAPCDECASCRLHEAGSHPDRVRIAVREDKQQVLIDDVRELIESLGLRSQRGGRRVAIVDPADAMNVNGANALLKTLEEPGAGALLILPLARAHRLPATIASRCQRLELAVPPVAVGLAWLRARGANADWEGLLAIVGGVPPDALALAEAGAAELPREMAELPAYLRRPDADPVQLAERWAKHFPAARLRWIENWITERIRLGLAGPAPGHTPATPGLPAPARTRHIQDLYGLLDETRGAREALHGSANVASLFERVLFGLSEALAEPRPARAG